ncbi:DoxX family protein [Crocosphaera sp. UHCC 0190]|uniref:DoxX family protein n=1 Tax=Crocosphaera sp. UHCC 0190 TaxID=3110246 RepID=UPI002B1FB5CF|nr:DoxX family protein [Crocosphaera sp. UHCC 0190]MEA5509593.1 DoxX family protein [Crocosphaera sp. UHCC 0190]
MLDSKNTLTNQPHLSLRTKDIVAAYTLLRIVVGVNYFNHGFTRIFDIPGFINGMVTTMQDSGIPELLVSINAGLVPPVELIVGALITVGFLTRKALIACFILMIILMYGITMIQNWNGASSQLIYNIALFILLAGVNFNRISVDICLKNRRN